MWSIYSVILQNGKGNVSLSSLFLPFVLSSSSFSSSPSPSRPRRFLHADRKLPSSVRGRDQRRIIFVFKSGGRRARSRPRRRRPREPKGHLGARPPRDHLAEPGPCQAPLKRRPVTGARGLDAASREHDEGHAAPALAPAPSSLLLGAPPFFSAVAGVGGAAASLLLLVLSPPSPPPPSPSPPSNLRCLLIPRSISPRCSGDVRQFSTIEQTTASNSLTCGSLATSKKSIASILLFLVFSSLSLLGPGGARRSTLRACSQGVDSSCVLIAPISKSRGFSPLVFSRNPSFVRWDQTNFDATLCRAVAAADAAWYASLPPAASTAALALATASASPFARAPSRALVAAWKAEVICRARLSDLRGGGASGRFFFPIFAAVAVCEVPDGQL